MLKRLPFLCAALLALAACSHDSGTSGPAQPAVTASTAGTPAAATTTAPASAMTAVTPASAGSAAPAASDTAANPAEPAPAVAAAPFVDNGKWVEGKNYFLIEPAQPTSHPGKIEVTEVFSYGCPACNSFHSTVDQIARSLPANAVMNYLAASFRPDENWPMYQRAFYAAQALDLVGKTHDAMFDAVWKTGELSTYNLDAGNPKPKAAWPTIDDAAKFYAKYGVTAEEFTGVANSFSVNTRMKRADDLMKAYGVESTPTMVINGKYRFTASSAGGFAQSIELTQWLVAKEAAGK
ncbi:thiol:disulfide interchange protein DsbA/DsbL [Rhodanobacter glycinis]|uniref:Thiol:disulfide interchange protein DsbA/DsbL n=1 Tax=Rhodanobacter glycinis TaxID=582702 RepID=A0A502F961_9GAMM|nr:thiol:disulfide interchange protein DsbA/DsbL [Rhodanobacter glycinis]TPG06469.1 thiol:disulfide interchange protein DsbA/DsbL [Rhodanobacter glycinis]TPG45900.1 thiol:disulfide interchange protein DsbA/DsbL [Rhodanobacter glycinis]